MILTIDPNFQRDIQVWDPFQLLMKCLEMKIVLNYLAVIATVFYCRMLLFQLSILIVFLSSIYVNLYMTLRYFTPFHRFMHINPKVG